MRGNATWYTRIMSMCNLTGLSFLKVPLNRECSYYKFSLNFYRSEKGKIEVLCYI